MGDYRFFFEAFFFATFFVAFFTDFFFAAFFFAAIELFDVLINILWWSTTDCDWTRYHHMYVYYLSRVIHKQYFFIKNCG